MIVADACKTDMVTPASKSDRDVRISCTWSLTFDAVSENVDEVELAEVCLVCCGRWYCGFFGVSAVAAGRIYYPGVTAHLSQLSFGSAKRQVLQTVS